MSEQHHSTSSAPNQSLPVVKKSQLGKWIAFVLIVSMVIISIFMWKQYRTLKAIQGAFITQANLFDAERKSFEEKMSENLAAQNKQMQDDLADLTQRTDNTAARVLGLTNINRDDWKLTEVNYLLRMANQRILLEHEADNALALAESANTVIAELDNADLFAARKKLAQEIQALKMASKVDREGIYLKLLALTQQIENLPLIEPLVADDEESSGEMDSADDEQERGVWQRFKNFGKKAWHKLSSYVRVRDQGRRVDAILPPEDQMYLKQNLRLMLEQAQIGMLREEQYVYQTSLDKAQLWIRDYYPLNEQAQIALNDMEQLKKSNVQQPLPDFSGSAALVKEYIQQKDRMAFGRHGGH